MTATAPLCHAPATSAASAALRAAVRAAAATICAVGGSPNPETKFCLERGTGSVDTETAPIDPNSSASELARCIAIAASAAPTSVASPSLAASATVGACLPSASESISSTAWHISRNLAAESAACFFFRGPSNAKGIATTATTGLPARFADAATCRAVPAPSPPPERPTSTTTGVSALDSCKLSMARMRELVGSLSSPSPDSSSLAKVGSTATAAQFGFVDEAPSSCATIVVSVSR
mmetsp:Transcript_12069/g.31933  ORF Transcript_12069/g.31933 Transcript_12069/m.31933 type:complete len:236 (-) Transcript_12069:408-1115(-)